jgi:TonB family protein
LRVLSCQERSAEAPAVVESIFRATPLGSSPPSPEFRERLVIHADTFTVEHFPPAEGAPTYTRVAHRRARLPMTPAPATPRITILQSIERPRAEDFERHYPRVARRAGIEGRVIVDCTVLGTGRLDCRVAEENPPGNGFGEASLAVARRFLMPTRLPDGTPTEGARLRFPLRWALH